MSQIPLHIHVSKGKKVYFLSDFHLKNFKQVSTDEREKKIVNFINSVKKSSCGFFFLGDVFDFWFEYKHLIPKGNVRIQALWLELKDLEIPVYFFMGNHDMWMKDYFSQYFGIKVFQGPREFIANKKIEMLIGHGDGLGPCDYKFKLFKRLSTSKVFRFLFNLFHPDIFYSLTYKYINSNKQKRATKKETREKFLDEEKEWLIHFSKNYLEKKNKRIQYFIFGHRHLPINHQISKSSSIFINTGDWIDHDSYASFDGKTVKLFSYKTGKGIELKAL